MSSPDYSADLSLALELADAADLITRDRFRALDLEIVTKPDNTPVTDADRSVENKFRELMAIARPNDHIIGEEFGGSEKKPDRYWVIDPIDGTKNFLRGVPTWGTLIALVENSEVVVGVCSAPELFRRWYAAKDFGSYLVVNTEAPRKLSVSKVAALSDASLAYSDLDGWGNKKEKFLSVMSHVWRTRGYGDFWSHMLVAEGAVDIAAEPSLALWDMAALDIIVREAGGRYSSLEGIRGPFGASGVSSNGVLHEPFLNALT
jgi:histidinol-phosphatase